MPELMRKLGRAAAFLAKSIIDPFTDAFSNAFGEGPNVTSANGTTLLAGEVGQIVDAKGHIWTITKSRQVALDGVADVTTSNVLEMAYVDGRVWQQNSAGLWWSRTALTSWTPFHGTRISPFMKLAPTSVLALRVGTTTATSITVYWSPPVSGATPFSYSVQIRKVGTQEWSEVVRTTDTSALISNLAAATSYNIEVLATNV